MVRMVQEIIPEIDPEFKGTTQEIESVIKHFDSDGSKTFDN